MLFRYICHTGYMRKKRSLFNELNIDAEDNDVRNIKRRVKLKINSSAEEGRVNFMVSRKKAFIAVIAAVLVFGISAFAAGGIITMRGSSSSNPDYKSLPTVQRVKKDIGYEAVLIEEFKNGYSFKDGNVVNNEFADESNRQIEKFKSVSFRYGKNDDVVYFSQSKYNSDTNTDGQIISNVGGTDIYYFTYMNKTVPSDYKLTEADRLAKENGELVFSYGSSAVEISKVQSVGWEKDGIHYLLMQIDGKLSKDELKKMAEEVIENL